MIHPSVVSAWNPFGRQDASLDVQCEWEFIEELSDLLTCLSPCPFDIFNGWIIATVNGMSYWVTNSVPNIPVSASAYDVDQRGGMWYDGHDSRGSPNIRTNGTANSTTNGEHTSRGARHGTSHNRGITNGAANGTTNGIANGIANGNGYSLHQNHNATNMANGTTPARHDTHEGYPPNHYRETSRLNGTTNGNINGVAHGSHYNSVIPNGVSSNTRNGTTNGTANVTPHGLYYFSNLPNDIPSNTTSGITNGTHGTPNPINSVPDNAQSTERQNSNTSLYPSPTNSPVQVNMLPPSVVTVHIERFTPYKLTQRYLRRGRPFEVVPLDDPFGGG